MNMKMIQKLTTVKKKMTIASAEGQKPYENGKLCAVSSNKQTEDTENHLPHFLLHKV